MRERMEGKGHEPGPGNASTTSVYCWRGSSSNEDKGMFSPG